jgi:hypothetical protein
MPSANAELATAEVAASLIDAAVNDAGATIGLIMSLFAVSADAPNEAAFAAPYIRCAADSGDKRNAPTKSETSDTT